MTKNIEVLKIERGKKIEVVGRFETMPVAKFHIENTFAERYPQGKFQTRKLEMPKSLLTDVTFANDTVPYLVVQATLNELDLKNVALDIHKDTLLGLFLDNVIENKRALNKIEKLNVEQNDEDGNVAEVRYITAETEPLPLPKIQSTLENMLFDTLMDGDVSDSEEEEDTEEEDETPSDVPETTEEEPDVEKKSETDVTKEESTKLEDVGNVEEILDTITEEEKEIIKYQSDMEQIHVGNVPTDFDKQVKITVLGTETGRISVEEEHTSVVPKQEEVTEQTSEIPSPYLNTNELVEIKGNLVTESFVEETVESDAEITDTPVEEEVANQAEENSVAETIEEVEEEVETTEQNDVEEETVESEEEIIIYDNGDGTFSDNDGNQVDEDGNIIKTKAQLEAEENVDDGDISDALDALSDLDDIPDLD